MGSAGTYGNGNEMTAMYGIPDRVVGEEDLVAEGGEAAEAGRSVGVLRDLENSVGSSKQVRSKKRRGISEGLVGLKSWASAGLKLVKSPDIYLDEALCINYHSWVFQSTVQFAPLRSVAVVARSP